MNDLTTERIGELVEEALERTAFVLADIVSGDEAAQLPQATRFSQLSFSGPADGTILLAASDGFVCELASSLLGIEPDEVAAGTEGQDALNELTNIVGGSIILQLGGAEKHFEYGLPFVLTAGDVPSTASGDVHCRLESEGELLVVTLMPRTDPRAAAA